MEKATTPLWTRGPINARLSDPTLGEGLEGNPTAVSHAAPPRPPPAARREVEKRARETGRAWLMDGREGYARSLRIPFGAHARFPRSVGMGSSARKSPQNIHSHINKDIITTHMQTYARKYKFECIFTYFTSYVQRTQRVTHGNVFALFTDYTIIHGRRCCCVV